MHKILGGRAGSHTHTHRDAPTHTHPHQGTREATPTHTEACRGAREARHSLETPRLQRGGNGEHPSLIRRFGDAPFVHNRLSEAHFHTYTPHLPTLQAWGFQQSALLRSAGRTDTYPQTPTEGHGARRHIPTHTEARGKTHPHTRAHTEACRGAREARHSLEEHLSLLRRFGDAPRQGGGGNTKNRRASRSAYSRTIFQYEI